MPRAPARPRPAGDVDGLVPAAEYVRMSTDHQRYSTANQSAAIHEYAASHGMVIVRTYTDEGKSGLDIGGRDALRSLIDDVERGSAPFRVILVLDVSRWGRFQNADESAHYEYLCTKAGIRLVYCAEPFDNDGSSLATIVKNVKRAMAGEYSRELSAKVFAGHTRLVKLGFHQGGTAGFGLRRALQDEHKAFKAILSLGEHKSIQTDRVVLVAGPQWEVDTVQRIYAAFVNGGQSERQIADELNAEGIATDLGRPWSRGTVHQVLTNEKYVGHNVYNRVSLKLRQGRVRNAPEQWVRCDGAFQGIVSKPLFDRVRSIIASRSQHVNNEQMLAMLRALLERVGSLSALVIDEQDDMPSSSAYQSRFGGLVRAYELIGHDPGRDYRYLAINRTLRRWHPEVVAGIVTQLRRVGAVVVRDPKSDMLTVNGEWTASVVIARCGQRHAGHVRWHVRFDTELKADLTLVARMDRSNVTVRDYYVVPRLDMAAWPRQLGEDNRGLIDSYRFDTLDVLNELAARSPLTEAA